MISNRDEASTAPRGGVSTAKLRFVTGIPAAAPPASARTACFMPGAIPLAMVRDAHCPDTEDKDLLIRRRARRAAFQRGLSGKRHLSDSDGLTQRCRSRDRPIWVAAKMRAGGACAHATLALETLAK